MKKIFLSAIGLTVLLFSSTSCMYLLNRGAQSPASEATLLSTGEIQESGATTKASAGEMKPFYDLIIFYDPEVYDIDQKTSSMTTLALMSKNKDNYYMINLRYQEFKDAPYTAIEIAEKIEQTFSQNNGKLLTEPKEIDINGTTWVQFTSQLIVDSEEQQADTYIYANQKAYYIISCETTAENFTAMQASANEFIQKVTVSKTAVEETQPLPETLTLSSEDLSQKPSWNAQEVELQGFSFYIPETWSKNEEFSQDNIVLYSPSNSEEKPSNIVVEIRQTNTIAPFYEDLTPKDVLEIAAMIAPKALDIQVGDSYQTALGHVISAITKRSNGEDTLTQTLYIFLLDNYTVIVYATDFADDLTPPLEEVQKYVVGTMQKKS